MQISCGGIYLGNGGSGLEAETRTYWALNPSLTPTQILAINAHILAIKYGSGVVISGLTVDISNATGYLFLTNPSVDLRWLKGFYLNLNDGAGKNLKVLISATAPSGEALTERLTTWTNHPTYPLETLETTGTTIDSAIETGMGGRCSNAYNVSGDTILNKLFKVVRNVTINAGALSSVVADKPASGSSVVGQAVLSNTAGRKTEYYTSTQTVAAYNNLVYSTTTTGTNFSATNSLSQVTMPAATGVLFSNPVVDAGFNYNATSYTATVTRN